MADQRLRIELSGGGPWGFRLQGGSDGQPITVSKIRRRSKADLVDLREGDIIVSTNGVPCQGRSTAQVMDSIDEAGHTVTMDLVRPKEGYNSNNAASHQSFTESRTDGTSTILTRKDTVQETRPDGFHSTSTTVTREQSYSMPQVQNTTPKPFISSGPSSVLDEADSSVTMTIDTKESNIPVFKVKNMTAKSGSTWTPDAQDPYQDEMMPSEASAVYMESPHNSYEEEEEGGYGMAVPKVMPATPGLSAVDIQKLLEPAESPTETPTRSMRTPNTPDKPAALTDPDDNPVFRKMYADSAFFDDPDATYPTIQEQVKLAHDVAKILMSEAAIQKSKGSRMFMKRRERAEKYVHEAKEEEEPKKGGFKVPSGAVTHKPPPEAFYKSLQKDSQIGVWNPILAAPPPDAPPPPPVISPSQPFDLRRTEDQKCEHTLVSPEKCFNLAAALHASKGRGGQIFAKRRAKSESWVIDEDNVKSAPPPIVPTTVLRPKNVKAPVRYEKSPWEAAAETGDVDKAFSTDPKNKRHTVGADVFKKIPNMSNVPRAWSPESAARQHDFKAGMKEKKNFKDFNVRPRGWGTGSSQASDDDRRSVSSVASSEGDLERRAPSKMAAGGNRFSMGFDPRQPVVGRNDLTKALGARGFVAVGNSGASDL